MAFDTSTRNRLSSFVSDARALLTVEFARQMQSDYGIDPGSGRVDEIDALTHLDDRQRETARILRDTLHHYTAGRDDKKMRGDEKRRTAAIDRIVREQAFTVLNRLAALRMMEARGLLLPSVAEGTRSDGFRLYQQLAGVALGETDEAYVTYLFSLFDEFAVELPVLFDRFSPQGRLFPSARVLRRLLEMINGADIAPLWTEDETIGWIYQYFNSSEERRKMRKASSAPRNSRELAVRNQFFTPRYVVEFLTDNTLGRIWYEMLKGETRLLDECDYLVRRPHEVFLAPGEAPPEPADTGDLSQEELLQQPVYILHRSLKDPRDLKMLDPACGSMHFGLYAFDLFETIYEEAWDEGLLGAWADAYPDKRAFLRDVPRLIIEHNIHGIDIDARAVQIAGLSLWLRAQRSWQAQGVEAAERPTITRSNVVVAEPMPGDEAELEAFLAAQFGESTQDQIVARLVRRVFEAMKLAGEAGSLLKIEEEIADDLAAAREAWATPRQAGLFEEPRQGEFFERPRQAALPVEAEAVSEEQFWEQVEARIYAALEAFAEQAAQGESYRRRLFAEDAAHGFAFIDLCLQHYDVLLINPPFGLSATASKGYIDNKYTLGKRDMYSAFVERSLSLLDDDDGLMGTITSRTGFFLNSFEDWRRSILLGDYTIEVFADLGNDVLDATIETAAYVLRKANYHTAAMFFRLLDVDGTAKERKLLDLCTTSLDRRSRAFCVHPRSFTIVPGIPFAYWVPSSIRNLFQELESVESQARGRTARVGLQTSDDFRFVRLWVEVSPETIVEPHWIIDSPVHELQNCSTLQTYRSKQWVSFAKGGGFQQYAPNQHLVVSWDEDGKELKTYNADRYGSVSRNVRSESHYFRPAITWSYLPHQRGSFRILPPGSIFSVGGPSLFADTHCLLAYLAICNSDAFSALMGVFMPRGAAGGQSLKFEVGFVQRIPFPEMSQSSARQINQLVRRAFDLTCDDEQENELSPLFLIHTHLRNVFRANWVAIHDEVQSHSIVRDREWNKVNKDLNSLVNNLYGFNKDDLCWLSEMTSVSATLDSPPDLVTGITLAIQWIVGVAFGRWDVRYATGEKESPPLPDPFAPLPVCPPGMLQNAAGLPAAPEEVPAGYPLRISWPGILVDDDGHPEDIVARVREALRVIWGEDADGIEAEACALLDVDSLRAYFGNPNKFFDDHYSRYSKSRRYAPIYWPLTTANGSYTLWLYYHRLDDGILYRCVNDFVDPKLAAVERQLAGLRNRERSRDEEDELEQLTDLAAELETFRNDLLALARFWRPNLNDGAEITAAPLRALFGHRKWRERLEKTWDSLQEGEYDWAHLAMSIWPARVVPKCVEDRSLAIAHDLESLFWVEEDEEEWRPLRSPIEEEAHQIVIRQSEERDRLREHLEDLAAGEGRYLPAMQIWQYLAEGAWDHHPLGLLLYPERAAAAAFEDATEVYDNLTACGQKLLQKDTKKNKRLLTKRLVERGTPELVDAVEATLADEPVAFTTLWQALESGERDELPLALALWPERVVGKALHDPVLATQHGLFEFFWYHDPDEGVRRRRPVRREIQREAARRGGDRL